MTSIKDSVKAKYTTDKKFTDAEIVYLGNICHELWCALADTGARCKREALILAGSAPEIYISACPACDIDARYEGDCMHCPMLNKWWTESGGLAKTCLDNNTWFSLWVGAERDEDRMKYASAVRDNIGEEWPK